MLKIQLRNVTIRHRELSAIAARGELPKPVNSGGTGRCPTKRTPDSPRTQEFTQKTAVTASYGNITVCAADERIAKENLARHIVQKTISAKTFSERPMQVDQMVAEYVSLMKV